MAGRAGMRSRLDVFLHREGFFDSRELAKAAVMEGRVKVDGRPSGKPGTQVSGSELIQVEVPGPSYVSRGGDKLEYALEAFGISVKGLTALDVGASTGGFTDCLLSRGASRVIALDVGRGQLHWKLRNDPRVVVIERYNARNLKPGDLPERPALATVDVSFISLMKVLEPVVDALSDGGTVVALVKPQFEAGRAVVEKGGVVRDPAVHLEVLEGLRAWLTGRGMGLGAAAVSPLKGPKGNVEFFIRVDPEKDSAVSNEDLRALVMAAHGLEG